MSSKCLSRHQACWSEFLSRFNFKISYHPGSQCKANALTRHSQNFPSGSDPCQDYMEQVVLKPKNIASSEIQIKPIRILKCSEVMPVDIETEVQPLSDVIQAAYNTLDEDDPVATVSQMLQDGVQHSREVSLSDCTMENDYLFYKNWLWIPENDELRLHLFQEAHDQAIAGHTRIAKTHDLLSCWYYWPKMVNIIWQYIRNCHVCS